MKELTVPPMHCRQLTPARLAHRISSKDLENNGQQHQSPAPGRVDLEADTEQRIRHELHWPKCPATYYAGKATTSWRVRRVSASSWPSSTSAFRAGFCSLRWMFLRGVTLWRTSLIPRALALLLLLGSLLQITGITLPQFISYPPPAPMLMGLPLGVIYLALAVWLIGKGFRNPPKSFAT